MYIHMVLKSIFAVTLLHTNVVANVTDLSRMNKMVVLQKVSLVMLTNFAQDQIEGDGL